MTSVTVNRMVAEVEGEGFPVVMLHGLGGTSNTFQPQMEALRDHRVIRIDLPGAGRSPPGHEAPSIASLADAVIRAAVALGVRQAHFVGHSMGTLLCQRIAAERPELVASLVLFGALIEATETMRAGLAGRARLARTEGMVPIADQIIAATLSADTVATQPAVAAFVRESVMRQDPEGYASHCEALARATAADFRLIGAPVLAVAGEADVVAPPSIARTLADRLKSASVAVIERSGHWLTLEKPRDCNARLRDFISRVPVG